MDLTLNTIGQTPMTYDEALQLIQSAKDAALKLFPGEEQAFEMIYMSRFRRLIREIWGNFELAANDANDANAVRAIGVIRG